MKLTDSAIRSVTCQWNHAPQFFADLGAIKFDFYSTVEGSLTWAASGFVRILNACGSFALRSVSYFYRGIFLIVPKLHHNPAMTKLGFHNPVDCDVVGRGVEIRTPDLLRPR